MKNWLKIRQNKIQNTFLNKGETFRQEHIPQSKQNNTFGALLKAGRFRF
jgi:hypothetical protein